MQGGSKADRWAARAGSSARAAAAAPAAAAAASLAEAAGNRQPAAAAAATALAAAQVPVPQQGPAGAADGGAAHGSDAGSDALKDAAMVARLGLTQGHRDGVYRPPAGAVAASPHKGSAMEAWMARAAAREFHVPWTDKRREFVHLQVWMCAGWGGG